jgi:TM2 domain-containing membrane protein YozV
MRTPILAAILRLIVAGLGQIHNGQVKKGVIFIVIQLINGTLTAFSSAGFYYHSWACGP